MELRKSALIFGNRKLICAGGGGEIIDRSLELPNGLPLANEPVNFFERAALNPDFPTSRADLGWNILEKIKDFAASLFVGNGGVSEFAATHRAKFFLFLGFTGHLFLFLSLGRLLFPCPGVFPLAGVEPMNRNDMQVFARLVVGQGDVKRLAQLNHCHHQTLRIWPCARPLLNDFTFQNHPQSLLA